MAQQDSKKPVHEVRRGSVKALIWENAGEHGVFHRFTIVRLYKDGDQWKTTASFGANDIPKLATVLVQVEDWINAKGKAAGKAA